MRGTWGNAIKAQKSGVWGIFPGSIFDQWTRFAIPYGAKRAALALATTADADPPTVLAGGGASHPVAFDDVPTVVLCTKKNPPAYVLSRQEPLRDGFRLRVLSLGLLTIVQEWIQPVPQHHLSTAARPQDFA